MHLIKATQMAAREKRLKIIQEALSAPLESPVMILQSKDHGVWHPAFSEIMSINCFLFVVIVICISLFLLSLEFRFLFISYRIYLLFYA